MSPPPDAPVRIIDPQSPRFGLQEFLIDSIFNDAKFNDLRPSILDAVATSGNPQGFANACRAIEDYLYKLLERCDAVSACIIEDALSQLYLFMVKASNAMQASRAITEHHSASTWTPPTVTDADSRAQTGGVPFITHRPLINKKTPIGAAGSCFATEISAYLKQNQYNYVITEPNDDSCAAWGGLYNTPSFRQLVEVAFGLRTRPRMLFECEDTGKKEFWDPFREGVFFSSVEQYEESTRTHLVAAREALLKTKVFIMTVGLNEIWRLTYDGSVLARYPRTLAAHLVHKQILTVEENVNELQQMLDVWKAHNPDLQVIITVSPVPLHATFRAEESHVISSTCHSKSILRVAVDEFVRRNSHCVNYFPAFEVVTYCTPAPWIEDCRHVSRETVGTVMGLFEKTFLQN
ncbi:MAG: GSCFA domain-containing protein [Candidatus Obscuribacterales bacterium]